MKKNVKKPLKRAFSPCAPNETLPGDVAALPNHKEHLSLSIIDRESEGTRYISYA